MKSKSLTIALKVSQIILEHSETDILEAINILKQHSIGSPLLDFLAQEINAGKPRDARQGWRSKQEKTEAETLKKISELRDSEPEKFQLLSEFSAMIDDGKCLKTNQEMRSFGEAISKSFRPKKTRRDTANSLIMELARRPLHDIERLVQLASTSSTLSSTEEYQKLAQFLIKGKSGDGD